MIKFTLYRANCSGNLQNCLYPKKIVVKDRDSFLEAIKFDHVSAKYKDNYRSKSNFIKADNIVLDCDNDHSDDPKNWVTSEDVATAFPGVSYAIAYSKSHMREKGDKSARPRFHVYFYTPIITDRAEYTDLKQEVASIFPFFDANALDSARFIFGSDRGEVLISPGQMDIAKFLEESSFAQWDEDQEEIPQGKRNSTMSHYAGKIIKRFGNTEKAHLRFLELAQKCTPPLEDKELNTIWDSAVSFGEKVAAQAGYIPPEVYNSESNLKPKDFSDVGQATVLAKEYKNRVRYSPATDFIVYNGSFWEESKPKAQAIAQELTGRQLLEARSQMKKAMDEMMKNGAADLLATMGSKKAAGSFNEQQSHAFDMYEAATFYRKYAIKRRDSRSIAASLKEARPMLEIRQSDLDTNEFLLNTPRPLMI